MASSPSDFGKAVVAAGIMPAGELKSIWDSLPHDIRPKDAASFATLLVAREKLTPYQVDELLAGRGSSLVMGDYIILDKIGAGGMGQVLKAEHKHMGRLVAVKLLPSAMTRDKAAIKRFQREVRAAARLSHPNIVQAYDASVQRGVHYLVMEYVEGKDLSQISKRRGPFPIAEALDYITQAARGLAYAHGEGVVHRDIKPANLLVDKKGTLKILDMGLARFDNIPGAGGVAAASAEGLTNSGQVMGTFDYMAPEQAYDTRSADARADIYSLGCTLYRLLVGENLYQAQSQLQKLLAHRENPIPSLCTRRTDISPAIDAIFARMVAKSPEDRYQTMTEVVQALETIQPRTNESASSPTAPSGKLTSFLQSMRRSAATRDSTVTKVAAAVKNATNTGLEQTVTYGGPEIGTYRKGEILTAVKARAEHMAIVGKRRRPPLKLIAAGLTGVLVLLLGVWVIVRDKGGNEVARLKVPNGSSVEVKPESEEPSPEKQSGDQQQPPVTVPKVSMPSAAPARTSAEPKPVTVPKATTPPAPSPPVATAPVATKVASVVPATPVSVPPTVIPPPVRPFDNAPPPAKAPFSSDEAKAHQAAWAKYLDMKVETTNSVGAKMILIPPGEFLMGGSEANERPQHPVVITRPFLMGATEVTLGQFKKFVAASGYKTEAEQARTPKTYLNPGYGVTDDSPISVITWNDAVQYCNWLSTEEKATYRLPTEAEWEYACRAGTTTEYSCGNDEKLLAQHGWYTNNANGTAHAVGVKLSNAFGLFDMHGNLFEWCRDVYDETWYAKSPSNDPMGPAFGTYRVIRGGHWNSPAENCRSAYRLNHTTSHRFNHLGFRCLRAL